MENWIKIKGYETSYMVSDLGNVKTLKRYKSNGKGIVKVAEKILKPRDTGKGYLIVTLYKDLKPKNYKVHRLVIENFLGHSDLHVDHIDMDRSNNKLSNLRYCTPRQNKVYSLDKTNHSSKYVGVTARKNKWIATCTKNGKQMYLGMFNCEFSAHLAYVRATK
jgi:hypothetical protein